ncbi:putative reverse transcriptase domain-containing protein [Tanacetum coccineum]
MPWTEMKQLMTAEFCSIEEIQRIEHELWNLKVKEYDIVAYTLRFNELALMCSRMVKPERVKVDAYTLGLTDNVKGKVTLSKPADLNKAVRMAHKLMEQKLQARNERILEGKKRKGKAFKLEIVVVRAIKRITLIRLCRITKSKEMRELWLPLLLMESFLCVNDVLLAMLVSVRSNVTSVERLDIRQGIARRIMLLRVLTLSLFGLVMIVVKMDDPNITMKEYIRLEEEKAPRRGKVYNWETATYGKLWDNEDVHDLRYVETEFPTIVFDNAFTSKVTYSCEPMVSPLNDNKIDFRISFDESKNEDYTFLSPEPTVSCIDDLDFFKEFENEFLAIVYNDALTSKSNFLTKPTLTPQHIDEFNFKDETSLSEYDEEEQNILYFDDLFPFNIIYPNDSKRIRTMIMIKSISNSLRRVM